MRIIEEYEAVSYTWGSPNDIGSITCQGVDIEVRANLVQVLRQVRDETYQRHLWVDALCINQTDLDEKGVHVNMMGEIYSHAWRVIICLGDDGNNGESAKIAFDVIREFNQIAAKYMVESRIIDGSLWSPQEQEAGYGPVTGDRLLHAAEVYHKPWFARVWAQQEVGLSRNALLAYGRSTINFTEIMEFNIAYRQLRDSIKTFPNVHFPSTYQVFKYIWATYVTNIDQSWYRSSLILITIARDASRTNALEFEDVLFRTLRMQKATEPRDHVYAFLGHPLARFKDGQLCVKADYTISLGELRLRLFSRLIDRYFRFLGLVWHKTLADLSEGPTWCPHLDVRRPWTFNSTYDASRGEQLLVPKGKHCARVNGPCFEVSVYVVDTVFLSGEIAGAHEENSSATWETTEKMLSDQPSLAERYWAIFEATESRHGLAYPDKALAFAHTLLNSNDKTRDASVARSFEGFCREHCPTIQTYLQEHKWFDRWATEETDFIPFIPRTGSSIKGERFFTTKKGYWYVRTFLLRPHGP